jgi:hypothetical protein
MVQVNTFFFFSGACPISVRCWVRRDRRLLKNRKNAAIVD